MLEWIYIYIKLSRIFLDISIKNDDLEFMNLLSMQLMKMFV